jgi:hypothetical protein
MELLLLPYPGECTGYINENSIRSGFLCSTLVRLRNDDRAGAKWHANEH